MNATDTSRFVRLQVELVLEISEPETLTGAAVAHVTQDTHAEDVERTHAEAAVREDVAEALAHLVDPFDLISDVPGVELAQASWSSERIDYNPDALEWDLDEDDEEGPV
ncbi:hypothetical protein [Streptomyces sp. ISL-100]|uniref:hypothetical protein n=1 Tax=Streptomyces sp. ISL-100 TaxID=2819173 RepID=UPI001BEA9F9E|nr:hypothetical protein [Streptomyces sp. ISL-100]MBT2395872.1 hypothetical protein [Streptomyces sp. ISL-100]